MQLWVLIQYIPPILYIYTYIYIYMYVCIYAVHPMNCETNIYDFTMAYNWVVDVSVFRRFSLTTFCFVDVVVCRRFGHVDVSVCWRFGLTTFWFVDVLVVDVSVCRRFDQLPCRPVTMQMTVICGAKCHPQRPQSHHRKIYQTQLYRCRYKICWCHRFFVTCIFMLINRD